MLGRRVHDERRQQLLQNVAVLLQHQFEELLGVVRHEIDFNPVMNSVLLYGFFTWIKPDYFLQRQKMYAAQVEIRVGGREAVQMRTADRCEYERVRMSVHLTAEFVPRDSDII